MLQEMHKSSGKHMPDSSDEFKIDSSASSDSEADTRDQSDERARALCDLVNKTAVVPLTKLPDDVTSLKTNEGGSYTANNIISICYYVNDNIIFIVHNTVFKRKITSH